MCIKVAERQSVQCRAVRLCSNPESQMFRTVMLILSVLVSASHAAEKPNVLFIAVVVPIVGAFETSVVNFTGSGDSISVRSIIRVKCQP